MLCLCLASRVCFGWFVHSSVCQSCQCTVSAQFDGLFRVNSRIARVSPHLSNQMKVLRQDVCVQSLRLPEATHSGSDHCGHQVTPGPEMSRIFLACCCSVHEQNHLPLAGVLPFGWLWSPIWHLSSVSSCEQKESSCQQRSAVFTSRAAALPHGSGTCCTLSLEPHSVLDTSHRSGCPWLATAPCRVLPELVRDTDNGQAT